MRQTCIVTGGAGFIGCAIRKSGQAIDRVIAIDNLHRQIHPSQIRPTVLHSSVELIIGDVTLNFTWDDLLANHWPKTIVHLAAKLVQANLLPKGRGTQMLTFWNDVYVWGPGAPQLYPTEYGP